MLLPNNLKSLTDYLKKNQKEILLNQNNNKNNKQTLIACPTESYLEYIDADIKIPKRLNQKKFNEI